MINGYYYSQSTQICCKIHIVISCSLSLSYAVK